MSTLISFQFTLQSSVSPDDTSWIYYVSNLPKAIHTNAASLVKCISIATSGGKQDLILRYELAPVNRVTRVEPLDRFLMITLPDLHLRWPTVNPNSDLQLATGKETADYVTRLLVTGIKLNGTHYNFFGHSNSQLKSRSCFMYAASKEIISSKIEAMGDFSKLRSVGKKAKRIGLLFSSAQVALNLPPERCEDIADIERDDFVFTDGCGLISPQLARHLSQRRNIIFRAKRYLPTVYQIRYRGYKGVLTLDPRLQGKTQVQFRESMRKFKDAADYSFAVVDYSKPYCLGSLNDEIIVLLHTLGVSQDTLLRKQNEHLEFLQNVSNGDSRAAFQFLSYCDRIDVAEKILLDGIETAQSTLNSLVKQEYTKMLNKRNEQRCRILIPKSRLMFGVCDPLGKLKDGECYVRITDEASGLPYTVINTEVLVTRNPCLHPGDLQKFRAVDSTEHAHLVDCIVFSTSGRRPSADLMSGGDLDGDKFFVTWDPDIIPRTVSEPAKYPPGRELVTFGEVNGDARAEYFARYTNTSLGRVKNLYMKWARLGNAMSSECQQLNRLFSQCVDGNRIKIPENLQMFTKLEDPPEPNKAMPPFILDVLHAASTNFIHNTADVRATIIDPTEVMDLFLTRDKLAMSEFELLKLVLQWCDKQGRPFEDYSHLLDFSALTDEQRIWLLHRLPPSATLPSLVRNGLLQSELIRLEELRRFSLDHPRLHWKPVFRSSNDRMARFLPVVSHSLETFHKKLIILSVDERLTVAIYVPKKIARASEVQVDNSVRVFALPHSQGPHSPNSRVMPTKVNYRLFCDDFVFQLYERQRSNTWIFLRRPSADDSLYRNEKSKGDMRRKREQALQSGINFDCKASIALDKISRDIQRHIGKVQQNGVIGAEVYVISNRDIESMRVLDQWINYIDTEQILPLFEKVEVDYRISKIGDTDWNEYPSSVATIVRDRSLAQMQRLDSIQDLRTMFDLLRTCNEKSQLRDTFAKALSLEASSSIAIGPKVLASTLLDYLQNAIYLIPTYFQSQTWKRHKVELEELLTALAPTLLQHLVLAENELGHFIHPSIVILLQELKLISLQNFAELIELIALTFRSAETALDMLLGNLEPVVPRLLAGRPVAVRQFASSLFGIALDYIDEASSNSKVEKECLKLSIEDHKDGFTVVKSTLRIDSQMSSSLKIGDHVRFTASSRPQNAPLAKPFSMDALVLSVNTGVATFRCLHLPPPYVEDCAWNITQCGSFVTSKTSFDALTAFYCQREACCRIYGQLLGLPNSEQHKHTKVHLPVTRVASLNESQNAALAASMDHSLTFIWGPPGTGKSHTIISILLQLLEALPKSRFLITAPTHNAIDNLLRRYISNTIAKDHNVEPVRVSTQLTKVAPDLRSFTCDAMLGKDLTANPSARRQAQRRIAEARLIFTTCISAGLGLLRTEEFDVVVIDEASQQTEPATLVPLVKGCSRAILVGDHIQLRATVQQHAVLTGHDVSLFERHYNLPSRDGVAKVMLDTQYRMHRDICDFSAIEFYDRRLQTAVEDHARPIPPSQFPWPLNKRLIWMECASSEDLGRQSKANKGQVELCKQVVQLLRAPPLYETSSSAKATSIPAPSIAILTPYTRQKKALLSAIPNTEVSSIDGFQGREADIVIFVTVRCNAYGDLGFLTDMRRLNVVMTRAKTGVVIIGNKNTLIGNLASGEVVEESRTVWRRLVERCAAIGLPEDLERQ